MLLGWYAVPSGVPVWAACELPCVVAGVVFPLCPTHTTQFRVRVVVVARSGFMSSATVNTLHCDLVMSANTICDSFSVGGAIFILCFSWWRCWGSTGTWWWSTRWSWCKGGWDNDVVAVVGQVLFRCKLRGDEDCKVGAYVNYRLLGCFERGGWRFRG